MIGKGKRKNFCDKIIDQTKFIPGVGKYDAHLSLDKVFRPMKFKGY